MGNMANAAGSISASITGNHLGLDGCLVFTLVSTISPATAERDSATNTWILHIDAFHKTMSTEGFEPSMLCIVSGPVPIRLMVNPGTISGIPESGYEPGFNSCKQDNSFGKPRGISPLESFADARPDCASHSQI
jgi:hypothetical protein